jgi:hypothetical protein
MRMIGYWMRPLFVFQRRWVLGMGSLMENSTLIVREIDWKKRRNSV